MPLPNFVSAFVTSTTNFSTAKIFCVASFWTSNSRNYQYDIIMSLVTYNSYFPKLCSKCICKSVANLCDKSNPAYEVSITSKMSIWRHVSTDQMTVLSNIPTALIWEQLRLLFCNFFFLVMNLLGCFQVVTTRSKNFWSSQYLANEVFSENIANGVEVTKSLSSLRVR